MKKSSFIANILIQISMLAILFIGNTSWSEEQTYEEKEQIKIEEELKEHLDKYATQDTKLELRDIVELEYVLSHGERGELLRLVDENKLKILSARLEKEKKGLSKRERTYLKMTLNNMHRRWRYKVPKEMTPKELIVLDKLLCTKWKEMMEALSKNDIDKVISYFEISSEYSLKKNKAYRKIFSTMSTEDRSKFIQRNSDIRFIKEIAGVAAFEIKGFTKKDSLTGEVLNSDLLFVEEYNGEWKIERMVMFNF